jgi:hypothetical protein
MTIWNILWPLVFMAVWYYLWSFVIFFPIWNVWTKKNLATLPHNQSFLLVHFLTDDFFAAPQFLSCFPWLQFLEKNLQRPNDQFHQGQNGDADEKAKRAT